MKGKISTIFAVECLNCNQQLQLEIHPLSEFTKNLKSHGWKTTSNDSWQCPECLKTEVGNVPAQPVHVLTPGIWLSRFGK